MHKTKLSLALAKITPQKAIGFTLAGLLAAAMANATTLDSKLASGVHKLLVGDYDGDQKADVLWQGRKEDEHELVRSAGAHVQRWKDGFLGLDWNRQDVNLIVGDFNGDAAADVLLQSKFSGLMSQIMHAEFDGLFGKPVQTIGDYHQGFRWDEAHHNLVVGDFNGDMRDDVFLQGHKNNFRHGVSLASEQGTFDTIVFDFDNQHLGLDWASSNYNVFAGDFDGNGQSELLLQPKTMGYVSHINSKNSLLDTLQQSLPNDHLGLSWLPKDHRLLVGDFNGDGKDDIFLLTTDNKQRSALVPSDGKGFSAITNEINFIPKLNDIKDVLVGDFDADGMDDIVLIYKDGNATVLMANETRRDAIESRLRALGLLKSTVQLESVLSSSLQNQSVNSVSSATLSGVASTSAPKINAASSSSLLANVSTFKAGPELAQSVGTTSGDGGVSGGAASYQIPIAVPPGRAGKQPEISLSYSSRSGNGVVGMGWSLNAGQSSIHRCASSVAQVGYTRSVMLDDGDRLCLDGSLLILESGTYGQSGATYRTELESLVRVKQFGGMSSASARFEVHFQNGDVREYGQSFSYASHNYPMSWHITRWRDLAGVNTVDWNYTSSAGELVVASIAYTGSGGVQGDRLVEFNYVTRTDKSKHFHLGGYTVSTKRLESIVTKVGNALVREYSVFYVNSASSNNSIATGVQECAYPVDGTAKQCLPAISFTWDNQAVSASTVAVPAALQNDAIQQFNQYYDINGDGRRELTGAEIQDANVSLSNAKFYAFFLNENDQVQSIVNMTDAKAYVGVGQAGSIQDLNGDGRPDLQDLNLDGRMDSLRKNSSGGWELIQFQFENGVRQDTVIPVSMPASVVNPMFGHVVPDMNGDGFADYLYRDNCGSSKCLKLFVHNKSTTSPGFTYWRDLATLKYDAPSYSLESYQIKDFNGDGIPDVELTHSRLSGQVQVTDLRFVFSSINNGVVTFDNVVNSWDLGLPTDMSKNQYLFIDINGDGLQDYIAPEFVNGSSGTAYWYVRFNDGKRFGSRVSTGSDTGIQLSGTKLQGLWGSLSSIDINGDGKEELFLPTGRLVAACAEVMLNGKEKTYCGDQLHQPYITQPAIHDLKEADIGLYAWKVIQFNFDGETISSTLYDPGIAASLQKTYIMGPRAPQVIDLDGDGQSEIIWSVRSGAGGYYDDVNSWVAYFQGSSPLPDGWHIKRFKHGTELLTAVTDGMGKQVQWTHHPISHSAGRNANQIPLYSIPANDSQRLAVKDGHHFYFTSSMYVVSSMHVSGPAVPAQSTHYGYRENMYHNAGRGVQGFRQIITEQARGDDGTTIQTITTFSQKFPLAGQVIDVEVRRGPGNLVLGNTVLSKTTSNWRWQGPETGPATPRDNGVLSLRSGTALQDNKTYLPWLETQTSESFEFNGVSMGRTVTTQSAPSGFGNVESATTTVTDGYQTHVTSITRQFLPNWTDWWLNKLSTETTTKTATPVGGTANSKTQLTTINTWHTNCRKPEKTTSGHQSNNTLQLVTEMTYDSYCNVDSTKTYAASDTGKFRRSAAYWGTDGYFVEHADDALGQRTAFVTDATHGQVTRATDPFKNQLVTRYDAFGRAISAQQEGRVSTGNAATTEYQWATSTEKAQLPAAVYKTINTHPNVKPTQTTWYDAFNRVLRVQSEDPLTAARFINVDTEYDAKGRVKRQSVPYFHGNAISGWTTFHNFDALDRPGIKSMPNDGSGLNVTYNYRGLVTDVQIGTNSHYQVQRIKNALGQWWQTTDQGSEGTHGAPLTTTFRYDGNGNPISISRTTSGGVVVNNTAAYNDIGQKTSMTDPERGTWSFNYNIWGELTKQTDAKGQRTWFDYDDGGRILKRSEALTDSKPVTPVASWNYSRNRVDSNVGITALPLESTSKTDSTGTISKTFTLNAEGLVRLSEFTLSPSGEASRNFSFTQGYNGNDLPETSNLANNRGTVTTSYNSKGFPSTTVNANGQDINPYAALDLDAFGNVVSARYGNGLHGTQNFSAQTGRITSTCVNTTANCNVNSAGNKQAINYAGTAPNGTSLGYDDYGNLRGQYNVIQNVTESFGYDRRMRLVISHRAAVLGGGLPDLTQTHRYQYDQLGNLIEKTDFAKVIDYTLTGNPHQAHKAWADAAKSQLVAEYVYDANGNLTSSSGLAAHTRTSVYNHQMVPTSITRGSASSAFAYDEGNERWFEKHISSGKTEKIYKLGKGFELKFTTENGVTTEEEQHYLGSNAQLMYKKAQNGKPQCFQWRYLHLDRMGSVETITNAGGAVVERRGFDPFGKPRAGNWMLDSTRDGTTNTEKGLFSRVTSRGYTGHDHIDSVGVIHMNGRTYDPELGRFMGVDPFMQAPLNSQSLNPYSYVMNNPLAGTDPTGYTSECISVDASCNNKKFSFLGFLESKGLGWVMGGNGKKGGDAVRAQMSDDMAGISGLRQRQRDELYAFFGIKLTPTVTVREVKVDENNNAKGGTERKEAGDRGSSIPWYATLGDTRGERQVARNIAERDYGVISQEEFDKNNQAMATGAAIGGGLAAGVTGIVLLARLAPVAFALEMTEVSTALQAEAPIRMRTSSVTNKGAERAAAYGEGWASASLSDAVEQFAGKNPVISMTDKGKRIYANSETGIQVVEDVNGKYFRIFDPSIQGKRAYLDLSGNIPNNKILENGKQMGRTQAEYNQVTHFNVLE
ncbi:FG-GAP-like repeat-containing protein [Permianibacter aggregans]|uniref:RHS repeat-associated protein n=1 Tax=Permianibacter aggregans TaxID=1510150 RepID=A0A4R6UVA7_9GAMM|nr:FG-GAP-like repeat-containing protein [Permianibacter aggregans]QGX41523.1 hypothetical protein E2H98_18345 [Permianibacter aggregans]TDQ51318.1 RHS repeat-associated protein [Permianibacter aggregans]